MNTYKKNSPISLKIDSKSKYFNKENTFKFYYFTDNEKILKEKNVTFTEITNRWFKTRNFNDNYWKCFNWF